MKKELSSSRVLDLYGANFSLVVTPSIRESLLERPVFKVDIDQLCEDCAGLSVSSNGHFAIFMLHGNITHEIIAHELFHVTHHMMEWIDHHILAKNHEPHAYLCGHITKLVYKDLKRWKIRVK